MVIFLHYRWRNRQSQRSIWHWLFLFVHHIESPHWCHRGPSSQAERCRNMNGLTFGQGLARGVRFVRKSSSSKLEFADTAVRELAPAQKEVTNLRIILDSVIAQTKSMNFRSIANSVIRNFKRLAEIADKESGLNRKCPSCAKIIKREAVVCTYCGRELPSPPSGAGPTET